MSTKTLAQLEKEYAAYIAGTKKAAKRERPRVRKVAYLIQSRAVSIFTPQGRRIGTARWGKWESWNDYDSNEANLKAAMTFALKRLKAKRIGTIVYVRQVVNGLATKTVSPLWEAKWGGDGIPYISWKANPLAGMWRRRLNS